MKLLALSAIFAPHQPVWERYGYLECTSNVRVECSLLAMTCERLPMRARAFVDFHSNKMRISTASVTRTILDRESQVWPDGTWIGDYVYLRGGEVLTFSPIDEAANPGTLKASTSSSSSATLVKVEWACESA